MKIDFKISKRENLTSLVVDGDLVSSQGASFKDQLQKLSEEKGNLELSLKKVATIDVSAVQLIKSLKQTDAVRKRLQIIPPDNSDVIELLARTGLFSVLQS